MKSFAAIFFVLFVLLNALGASAEKKEKRNFDPDAQLRVGVKFRPAECDRRSKSGDRLSMHYTGETHALEAGALLRLAALKIYSGPMTL